VLRAKPVAGSTTGITSASPRHCSTRRSSARCSADAWWGHVERVEQRAVRRPPHSAAGAAVGRGPARPRDSARRESRGSGSPSIRRLEQASASTPRRALVGLELQALWSRFERRDTGLIVDQVLRIRTPRADCCPGFPARPGTWWTRKSFSGRNRRSTRRPSDVAAKLQCLRRPPGRCRQISGGAADATHGSRTRRDGRPRLHLKVLTAKRGDRSLRRTIGVKPGARKENFRQRVEKESCAHRELFSRP